MLRLNERNLSSFTREQQTDGFCHKVEQKVDTQVNVKQIVIFTYYVFAYIYAMYQLFYLVFFVNFENKCRLKQWKKI